MMQFSLFCHYVQPVGLQLELCRIVFVFKSDGHSEKI